jgi:hypothetical protein
MKTMTLVAVTQLLPIVTAGLVISAAIAAAGLLPLLLLVLVLLLLLLLFLLLRWRDKQQPVTIEERDRVVVNANRQGGGTGTAQVERQIVARDARGNVTPIAEEVYTSQEGLVDDPGSSGAGSGLRGPGGGQNPAAPGTQGPARWGNQRDAAGWVEPAAQPRPAAWGAPAGQASGQWGGLNDSWASQPWVGNWDAPQPQQGWHAQGQGAGAPAPGGWGNLAPAASASFGEADNTNVVRPETGQRAGMIVVRQGKQPGRIFELRKGRVTIGRSRDSDIFLQDLAVSRLHTTINRENGGYVLRDEGSVNGTYVNGKRITEQPLEDGDEIQVGQSVLAFVWRGQMSGRSELVKEPVSFTAFYPLIVSPDRMYSLVVYTHLPTARERVRQDVKRFRDEMPGIVNEVREEAKQQVARRTRVTVLPDCAGVMFNPNEHSFQWFEDLQRSEFRFMTDPAYLGRSLKGEIAVYVGPLQIASLDFTLLCKSQTEVDAIAQHNAEVSGKLYERIFASYSHLDTDIALACRNAYAALGLTVLIDLDTLRSGDEFAPTLKEYIKDADVFQLFWSQHSSQSDWVRREWEYALKLQRGPGFVRPVYWERPLVPAPPPLRGLHFKYVPLARLVAESVS